MSDPTRPAFVTDEQLEYLDDLRETGITNMFGAGEYVSRRFGLDRKAARDVLVYWMRTYGARRGGRQGEPRQIEAE